MESREPNLWVGRFPGHLSTAGGKNGQGLSGKVCLPSTHPMTPVPMAAIAAAASVYRPLTCSTRIGSCDGPCVP